MHLLVVKHRDQWACGNRKPFDGGTVEHNRYHPAAEPMDEASRLGVSLLVGEVAQSRFNRGPIGLLFRCQLECVSNATNID
jgi:hypothetical protein